MPPRQFIVLSRDWKIIGAQTAEIIIIVLCKDVYNGNVNINVIQLKKGVTRNEDVWNQVIFGSVRSSRKAYLRMYVQFKFV